MRFLASLWHGSGLRQIACWQYAEKPNFTGDPGQSYTLVFAGVNDPLNGRHALDNLSFGRVPVPEPGTMSLVAIGALVGLGVLLRR